METKPLQVMLPAHAHTALRVLAIQSGQTATKVVIEALNRAYPQLRVNDIELPPASTDNGRGSRR